MAAENNIDSILRSIRRSPDNNKNSGFNKKMSMGPQSVQESTGNSEQKEEPMEEPNLPEEVIVREEPRAKLSVVQKLTDIKISPIKINTSGVKKLMSPNKTTIPIENRLKESIVPETPVDKVSKKRIRQPVKKQEPNVVTKTKGISNFDTSGVANNPEAIKEYLSLILTISPGATETDIKTGLNILNGKQLDDILRKVKLYNRKLSSTGSKPEKINKIYDNVFSTVKINT